MIQKKSESNPAPHPISTSVVRVAERDFFFVHMIDTRSLSTLLACMEDVVNVGRN